MEEKSRYQINNAAYKIDGYFHIGYTDDALNAPLDRAFDAAKAECLIHLKNALKDVEDMTVEQFLYARKKNFTA